ncbi:MAG: adenylate/guanylate cyclase domain-containing protein [Planctomycetota bacterium]|jgi:adenylate cyclase
MPEIACLPDDRRLTTSEQKTLLGALVGGDVPIAHACGGKAQCSTCRLQVIEGLEALTPRTDAEQRIAARLSLPDDIRLACQTKTRGDVRVRRLVLDDQDLALASQTANPDAGTVGRQREVSVLFLDVEGFTGMSEALPAYDVVHVLNRFYARAGEVIGAAGGTISNYMGDGLMALFDAAEDACGQALCAGCGLLEVAREMDGYVRELYGRGFGIRVGVHHGPAVVGHVGHHGSRRETAIGDTVNLASRIEAANKETGTRFLASDDVRHRCGGRARFGRRFDLSLRGHSGSFVVHEVLGEDPADEGARPG